MDYLKGVSGDFVLRMAYGVYVDIHNVVTPAVTEVIVASLHNIRFR